MHFGGAILLSLISASSANWSPRAVLVVSGTTVTSLVSNGWHGWNGTSRTGSPTPGTSSDHASQAQITAAPGFANYANEIFRTSCGWNETGCYATCQRHAEQCPSSWSRFSSLGIDYSYAQWETSTETWTVYTQETEVVDGYTYAIGTRTYHQTTERTIIAVSTIAPTPICEMPSFTCTQGSYCVPDGCTVQGGTVQLLYWPASKSTPGGNQTRSHAIPGVPRPTEVVTALYKNLTLTWPSVYIDFKTAFALDKCGQTVGDPHPGAIIPLDPKDLYTINADYDWIVATSTIRNTLVTTTFYMSKPMNYHDLTGLPPGSAYEEMPLCVPVGCPVITPSLYHPQLVLPTQIRALDPAWKTCGLDWQGLWDPPIALQPALVVDPVTTQAGSQQTVSASPASTVAPETPLPTSLQPGSSMPATTGPAAAVGSQGATLANDPSSSTQLSTSTIVVSEATGPASRVLSLLLSELPATDASTSSQLVSAIVSPLSTAAGSSPQSTASGGDPMSEGVSSLLTGQPSPTNAYQVFSQAKQSAASLLASPIDTGASSGAASSQNALSPTTSDDQGGIDPLSTSAGATISMSPAAAAPGGETVSFGSAVYPTQPYSAPSSDPQDPASIISPSSGPSAPAEAVFTLASETLTAIPIPPTNGNGQAGPAISVASQTIAVNSDPTVQSGHTLGAATNGIVVDGTLLPFSTPTPFSSPPASVLTLELTFGGTSAITASLLPQSEVQIGAQTLRPGSSALVTAGYTLSAVPSGIVEDGSTTLLFPTVPTQDPGNPALLPVNPEGQNAPQASSAGRAVDLWPVLASQSLTPNSPALVLSGRTFTAVSNGILEDGTLLGYPTTLPSSPLSATNADPNAETSRTATAGGSSPVFLPAIAFGSPTLAGPTPDGTSTSRSSTTTAAPPLGPPFAAKSSTTPSVSAAAAAGSRSGFLSMAISGWWAGVCVCASWVLGV
ncbi:hypothetical protein LTR57_009426 [Friedmanniomyces endolithicus]|nr:hypothetical protein LTR35_006374 [Friedmanniomyces endolithicus]KAK0298566.1 hypothetical protein LTS00_002948 [Friedmanniomyces endolithicus]KAK0920753.1 hypothetical protein LTR57_009426 [Friedmanniomyces endolithicus]KAK0989677.1 hypothetical protein LTS01_008840 [Friedmanniomyces endolithicus]KAK1001520.1 hypothetical protein LTR54_008417 [Friedmanniomyces endolithicus]